MPSLSLSHVQLLWLNFLKSTFNLVLQSGLFIPRQPPNVYRTTAQRLAKRRTLTFTSSCRQTVNKFATTPQEATFVLVSVDTN